MLSLNVEKLKYGLTELEVLSDGFIDDEMIPDNISALSNLFMESQDNDNKYDITFTQSGELVMRLNHELIIQYNAPYRFQEFVTSLEKVSYLHERAVNYLKAYNYKITVEVHTGVNQVVTTPAGAKIYLNSDLSVEALETFLANIRAETLIHYESEINKLLHKRIKASEVFQEKGDLESLVKIINFTLTAESAEKFSKILNGLMGGYDPKYHKEMVNDYKQIMEYFDKVKNKYPLSAMDKF